MPNTSSAKKAARQSKRKKAHNLFWKKRIKGVLKNIQNQLRNSDVDIAIIKTEESKLYKAVDKAAKSNVIHKNKARRIKSKVSKEIAVHANTTESQKQSKKAGTSKGKSSK